MLGESAALKTIAAEGELCLRAEISKTGREDSLSQEGWEMKQKHAISVWINAT